MSDGMDDLLAEFEAFEKKAGAGPKKSDPGVHVTVSEDKQRANASVIPSETGEEVDKQAVLKALRDAGVLFGIDEGAIDEIFSFGTFGVDVPVAKAKPTTHGKDAKIEYQFDVSGKRAIHLQEDQSGSVDLKEMNLVTSVKAGSVIAVKTPPGKGEAGMNVLGEKIPAEDGKDIELPLGDGVEANKEGDKALAKIDGQPILKGGKLIISPVFEVTGDVDYSTGNITFNGSVVVRGNVLSDFKIKAATSVEVMGNIEKAVIEAGGDVVVKGGLYGAGEGKIASGGNITIRSVESGILEADGTIFLGQSSRYSTLQAGESIILDNSKGSVVGGKCMAGKTVEVANLGSSSFTETVVEIGVNPKIKNIHAKLTQFVQDHVLQMEKMVASIKQLKEMEKQGPLAPDKQEILKKLVPAAHKLRQTLETEKAKKQFLDDKLKALRGGKVKVKGTAYPKVRIATSFCRMELNKEVSHSSFYEQDEQIVVGPL